MAMDTESTVPPSTLEADPQARNFGMFCHLASLAGFLIPFGNILGPLIVWLMKKQEMPFVDDQGKEALNFNITIAIAGIISAVLTVILIGFLLLIAVFVTQIVFTIIAAIKASQGEAYRYPFALRLVK